MTTISSISTTSSMEISEKIKQIPFKVLDKLRKVLAKSSNNYAGEENVAITIASRILNKYGLTIQDFLESTKEEAEAERAATIAQYQYQQQQYQQQYQQPIPKFSKKQKRLILKALNDQYKTALANLELEKQKRIKARREIAMFKRQIELRQIAIVQSKNRSYGLNKRAVKAKRGIRKLSKM